MSSGDWQQIWAIFEDAIALPPQDRPALLDQACGEDEKLRHAVEEVLAADGETDSFLDQPIAHHGGPGGTRSREGVRPPRQLPRDTAIGPYRILRRIGQGGMSTVYLAVRADDAFKRRVVVKLIRPGMESEAIQQRLRTERQILASLDHPYVARLYDGGTTGPGLPYFVLEYVEGVAIDVFCQQNRLSVDERLTLFRKVCAAVHYAHQNLVVHRDLKPSNILVTAEGDPKLLDFGIAKLLNPELGSVELEPTATWHRVLTPNYASPEQIRGKLITTASDVYALGVLLYKLLTGQLPYRFSGRSADEIESILSESEPLPPSVAVSRSPAPVAEPAAAATADSQERHPGGGQTDKMKPSAEGQAIPPELRRQLAGDLDAIVLKALRSVPLRRYSSVEQLASDVECFQTGLPVAARAGSWRYRAGKFIRRNRRAVASATAVVLLLVGFAVATTLQAARIAAELEQTRRERDKQAHVLSLVLELFEHSNPYVVPGKELTVREALERSVPVLEDGLGEQPEVRAALLHTAGSILGVLGVYDAARDQLAEALSIRRRRHGDAHPDVVATLSALASAEKELGELERAEELARRAVAVVRGMPGSGSSERSASLLARALNELVSVLCYRDEFEAAEALALEALALAHQLPAGSTQRLAATWHMARVRSVQGEYREAVRYNRETLALRRARHGEQHPAQIATLNNLGLNLRRLEELESAERAYREAVELQRDNFGEEHANAFLLNNLAGVLYARGDFAAAEGLYRQALEVTIESRGRRHWTVFVFELRIARTRIRQGAAAEAEAQLRRLLELWHPELGEHWRIDEGRSILGESVSAQGRCEEAEPLLVDSFERLLGEATDRTRQDAFSRLREHLERCGKAQEAARFEAMLQAPPAG